MQNRTMTIPLLLVVLVTAAFAQDSKPSSKDEGKRVILTVALLKALDVDHDGIISAEEIAQAPASLKSFDPDRDGKLTAVECGMKGGLETLGPKPEELVKALMSFDRNGDGKLERTEVPERMRGLFDRADPGKTGVVTPDQVRAVAERDSQSRAEPEPYPGYNKRAAIAYMRRFPVNAALDADHNGEVSAAEMERAPEALRNLDRNRDGKLTEDEVAAEPVATLVIQFMLAVDTDGDGKLSEQEISVPEARQYLAALKAADANHDGFVTEEEFTATIHQRADLNHDGVVTNDELQQARRDAALGEPPAPKPKR